MRIALINSEYPSPTGLDHGGIATYTYTLASALFQQDHRVHVFIREGTIPDKMPDGINVHTYRFKPPHSSKQLLNKFRDGIIQWEQGHARDIRDKLIAVYNSDGLDVAEFPEYGGLAAKCVSVPFKVVVNFHTPSELVDMLNNTMITAQKRKWYKYEHNALLRADLYRSPSNAMRDEVCKLYKINPGSINIIRNPVSISNFDSIKKSTPQSSIDMLFSGRIERRKGADLILKSIKDILNISPGIHITFAGETSSGSTDGYRSAIERTLNDEQRKRIWFLGALQAQSLSLLYCRSSVLLFPSVFENAPYSLFEAIAAKLPVIASSSGGIKEIITHDKTGLLFSYNNADELICSIKRFIENQQHSRDMAELAYAELKQYHAPELIAKQSVLLYQSGLNTGKNI